MRTKISLVLCVVFSLSAVAADRTNCPVAVINNLQIESNFVLYLQQGAPWRRLGGLDEDGTAERYSAMLAAHMAGKRVMVSYKRDDYDCSETNYTESAYLVRTYN